MQTFDYMSFEYLCSDIYDVLLEIERGEVQSIWELRSSTMSDQELLFSDQTGNAGWSDVMRDLTNYLEIDELPKDSYLHEVSIDDFISKFVDTRFPGISLEGYVGMFSALRPGHAW